MPDPGNILPRDEIIAGKLRAYATERQTPAFVLDVLLAYKEEVCAVERDGRLTIMELWQFFRREGQVSENCTYSAFCAALKRFRELVGLPLSRRAVREGERDKKAGHASRGSSHSPSSGAAGAGGRIAGKTSAPLPPGISASGAVPIAPAAAGTRTASLTVPVEGGAPSSTVRTLKQIALARADAPGSDVPGGGALP